MQSIVRRYPDVRTLQSQFNRLLEPFARLGFGDDNSLERSAWMPSADVAETADKIILTADLPGLRQEDIELRYEDGLLSIKGERQIEKESSTRTYHRVERNYGSFVRSFTLPRTVDPESISASYRDGVLEVSIPKRDEAKPKQIKIGIS